MQRRLGRPCILTWAPPAMSSPSKTGRRRMHSLWFRHLSMNVLSVSLSLECCNLLGERFLREDGRGERGAGAQRIGVAVGTALHQLAPAVGLHVFVGFHVNTLPVLPSLFLPFCLMTIVSVQSHCFTPPLPSLAPFSPSRSSLPCLLVKLFPLSRELQAGRQAWATGESHFSVTPPPPQPPHPHPHSWPISPFHLSCCGLLFCFLLFCLFFQ